MARWWIEPNVSEVEIEGNKDAIIVQASLDNLWVSTAIQAYFAYGMDIVP